MVGQVVTMQVGQCGNQLGLDFFGSLAREGGGEAQDATRCPLHHHLPAFFREAPSTRCSTARAVLLDAEPRVIANVCAKSALRAADTHQWQYPGMYVCMCACVHVYVSVICLLALLVAGALAWWYCMQLRQGVVMLGHDMYHHAGCDWT